MGQGVIRSLKAKYLIVLVQKYIRAIYHQKSLPKISILDAMHGRIQGNAQALRKAVEF